MSEKKAPACQPPGPTKMRPLRGARGLGGVSGEPSEQSRRFKCSASEKFQKGFAIFSGPRIHRLRAVAMAQHTGLVETDSSANGLDCPSFFSRNNSPFIHCAMPDLACANRPCKLTSPTLGGTVMASSLISLLGEDVRRPACGKLSASVSISDAKKLGRQYRQCIIGRCCNL